jgi:hypothetical protein
MKLHCPNGILNNQGNALMDQRIVPSTTTVAILEIGAATSWNVTGGAASFAPNFAVETTPIEN